jgi:acyl-CoA synthetase (AMP-forming)/AMP-acid ligase II/acyl carrier protein/MFS family permease
MPQTENRSMGRQRLVTMGTSYAMGTFNDNFFKQAGLLLAAAAALFNVQGIATLLFALPFVAFSAWTGWLADRLPKKRIVVWSKAIEIVAMGLGIWALYTLSWPGIVFVVFFMGLQSTFFSPAINGSIPENFDAPEVPRVNALLKLATTLTILLGIALAGPFLDLPAPAFLEPYLPAGDNAFGRLALGVFAVTISVIGFIAALMIKSRPNPVRSSAPFPWRGPIDSARHALACRREDRPLFLALLSEAFFYFFSSFVVLCITNLGKAQFGLSMTMTSLLNVALMVGVCAGSLLAGRWAVQNWSRHLVGAGLGMGLCLFASSFSPYFAEGARLPLIFPLFAATGFFGGIYLIPVVSFEQVRPAAHEKGKILGISNFACFIGIMISGPLFGFLMDPEISLNLAGHSVHWQFAGLRGLTPAKLMGGAGLAALLFMLCMRFALKRAGAAPKTLGGTGLGPLGYFLRGLLALRYRISAKGLDEIEFESGGKPIIFLPNHPALVDPLVVYSLLIGARPRPLADEARMSGLWGKAADLYLKAVKIPDLSKISGAEANRLVQRGLGNLADAVEQGHSILLYTAGRIYRTGRESLGGNSGLARILEKWPEARLVLVRTTGLWGSSFSYAGAGGNPNFTVCLLKGLRDLAANLFFFMPRRRVEVEFAEVKRLSKAARPDSGGEVNKKMLNAWLESFYNEKPQPALGVPRYFWQGARPYELPEAADEARSDEQAVRLAAVSPAMRREVYAVLREAARLEPEYPITDNLILNADLDLDSLSMMEVVTGLEERLNVSLSDPSSLVTVRDALLAVSGQGVEGARDGAAEKPTAPAGWFAPVKADKIDLDVLGGNIPDAFLRLARRHPEEIISGDRSGLRNRRAMLTAALVLAERIKAMPGKRIGLMLPATPAALGVWLAAMLAGKETAFFNWTVGQANLKHCIKLTGVSHILTSATLLDRLERQGLSFGALPADWHSLERLAGSLRLGEKLRGLAKARFTRSFAGYPVAETAAILFTSGSETLPKAVPLTHLNLLTNASDAIRVLGLAPDEKIVAMLPPFHSFGLLADLVLPLAFGLRAAFHPNPTESAKLTELIHDFKLTLLPATPTFLDAVIERSRGTDNLASLRYAFAGAEKCPEHVYRAFAENCPRAALCEGYGITECSPVVSVNRPGDAVAGTIGQALPSVQTALVREEDGKILGDTPADETGMLLVRGSSIFGGYLGDAPSPFVEYKGENWYRTGDLASMDAEGRITFRGRLKRFVKIGGEMISLPQIENALLAAFGGRPDAPAEGPALAVEAGPEETGAEIVLFTPMPLKLAEVNAALRQAGLSALHSVKRVADIREIPLLGSGKTDYRSLKELLQAKASN